MPAATTLLDFDHQFLVDLYYDEEVERFTAVIPALPGCITEAGSLQKARQLILEAASIYLESLSEMAAGLPAGYPAPMADLTPLHSSVIGIREIAAVLELIGAPFQGSHVAVSNRTNQRVMVFPVDGGDLSFTTRQLLQHYAGVEILDFMDALDRAEDDHPEADDFMPPFPEV